MSSPRGDWSVRGVHGGGLHSVRSTPITPQTFRRVADPPVRGEAAGATSPDEEGAGQTAASTGPDVAAARAAAGNWRPRLRAPGRPPAERAVVPPVGFEPTLGPF